MCNIFSIHLLPIPRRRRAAPIVFDRLVLYRSLAVASAPYGAVSSLETCILIKRRSLLNNFNQEKYWGKYLVWSLPIRRDPRKQRAEPEGIRRFAFKRLWINNYIILVVPTANSMKTGVTAEEAEILRFGAGSLDQRSGRNFELARWAKDLRCNCFYPSFWSP